MVANRSARRGLPSARCSILFLQTLRSSPSTKISNFVISRNSTTLMSSWPCEMCLRRFYTKTRPSMISNRTSSPCSGRSSRSTTFSRFCSRWPRTSPKYSFELVNLPENQIQPEDCDRESSNFWRGGGRGGRPEPRDVNKICGVQEDLVQFPPIYPDFQARPNPILGNFKNKLRTLQNCWLVYLKFYYSKKRGNGLN